MSTKLFAPLLAAAAILIGFIAYAAGVDVASLPPPRGAVTFTDRSGLVLGTVLASDARHAVAVPLREVSPAFVSAIVAAEDGRFWQHGAIDAAALLRAARDYAVYGEARSGGSTIEMQLARLLWPSPSTFRGKVEQIAGAERIVLRSTREAVLEAYVNRVPMGGNLYGVEAAARTYFGEPAADLDLAQAALLAAIPNDPARLSPDVDWSGLRARQRYVLDRMTALHLISPQQAHAAFAETLVVRRHDTGIADAPHALFALYPALPPASGRVRTTIDRALQRFVQAQAADVIASLRGDRVLDAAAIVVDNRTGDVVAYVGSPDYFSDEALGRNDGVAALRQPGSSLKPFTYALALERGTISSTTILPDVPASYAIPGGRLYQPADYSGRFSGPVRVRYALANSLNVPAVHVLADLGVDPLLQRLRDLGFSDLHHDASYYGLGLTLGAGEVTLWQLAQAYSTIARDGQFLPLRLLANAPQPSPRQIGDPRVWSLVTDMLADRHVRAKSFGTHSVLDMPFDAAVKTGTSSDFRDTWTVGFSRDYTVAAWVGNFDGSAMHGVSGVTGAGPLWNRIMLHLGELREPAAFPAPHGYARATICATTGFAPARDCDAIVREWVLPGDLARIERPHRMRLGREYDAWLAAAPQREGRDGEPLRILFPRDGDVFYLTPSADPLQRTEQRVALRAAGGRAVSWSVGGIALHADSEGTTFLPLRLGRWNVEARDGSHRARSTIIVLAQPPAMRPGFSAVTARAPERCSRCRR